MKSMEGMLKVIKAFSNYTKEQRKRIMKKQFEYQIPDFCPCEEIYDSQRAIMIGEGSYFKEDGLKTTIVFEFWDDNSQVHWKIDETTDWKDEGTTQLLLRKKVNHAKDKNTILH